ncbi:MFS transporter [Lapillicoccus sp.]|uniref:MFS transporter n=1 Tax=Lapillicoccus sp. TaxID=1909287 RepID=UPI0039835C4A
MKEREGALLTTPSYASVFARRGFPALFVAAALSTWGDYIARLTIAAVVFERTRSPLATATVLAVSMLPSIFGRSLLGPLADRIPYKHVLIGAHLTRSLCVLALIGLVTAEAPVGTLLIALLLLETFGGPAVAANQVLMTDLFEDRRLYVKAMGLTALGEQVNQAAGLALGGLAVGFLGAGVSLAVDLMTFLVSAAVVMVVVRARPVVGTPGKGFGGFFRDIALGGAYIRRHRVLRCLLGLSLVSTLAIVAPEAIAIPYAGDARLGGLLMAAPIAGAALGVVLVGRWQPEVANSRIIVMALLMPAPLFLSAFQPSIPVTWVAWFVSGALQAFMLPLQSTFSLLAPKGRRATIFGLAGAVSVTSSGLSYLLAGWLSELTSPAAAVTMCAVISLGAVVLVASRWPRRELETAVDTAYAVEH